MDDRPAAASAQEIARSVQPAIPVGSNGAPAQSETSTTGAKDSERKSRDEGSIKETIEQILVAFILAFVFRAFVVEAFVIPTGSMAPTLLGAHMRFTCDDCGYQFTANYTASSNAQGDLLIRSTSENDYRIYCPNCGYKFPLFDP